MRAASILISKARTQVADHGCIDADTAAQMMELGLDVRSIESQLIQEQE